MAGALSGAVRRGGRPNAGTPISHGELGN